MNALPSIEIYVSDKSYAAPDLTGDRSIYIPLFSEKGPDNTIEKLQSASLILEKYGKPNAQKYGFGLYFAIKSALYTSEVYITRLLPDDATYSNTRITINTSDYSTIPTVSSNVTDSNTVPLDDVSLIEVGDIIYFGNDYTNTYVVQSKDTSYNTITIDEAVTLSSGVEVHKVPSTIIDSVSSANSESELSGDSGFGNSLFTIYPIGRGGYYNKFQVEFVRNETMEYLYVDDNGNPLYPYMFYDVYVFELQEDGSRKLVEDPITVSLAAQSPDGTVFRHPVSGKELFVGTRINEDSENIKVLVNEDNIQKIFIGNGSNDSTAASARYQFSLMTANPLTFENGSDGSLFTSSGQIDWSVASQLLISAYNGSLNDELAKITDTTYQYYPIDYVPDPGYPVEVKAAIRELCDIREDCLGLIATPNNKKYTQDIESRNTDVPYNTYNTIIYTQWRKIFDPYTGKYIEVPPTYHALENHLDVDNRLGIAEPVAMFKAVLQEPAELVYSPLRSQANDLASVQLNPTIQEPDGTYIPTQYTSYKRLSVLQRAHVVKVIHKFRKDIPKLLKDLLQRKATADVINEASRRVNKYLSEWLEGGKDFTKEALKSYGLNVTFDEVSSTLYMILDLQFIRAIEHIKIFMNVR